MKLRRDLTQLFISAVIYVCFHVFGITCEILRLPCKSYANFSIIKHNYALEGFVIKTLHFVSENQCKSTCLMTPGCKSYNKEVDGDQRCELNNKTTEDKRDVATIVRRSGWIFGSTDFKFHLIGQICKEKDPCPKGVMCRDTCECPGYECFPCKYGKTGLRCDEDDACASNPCQNDGTCVNGFTFFTCACAPGYTGPTCSASSAVSCSSYSVLSEANRAVTYIHSDPVLCDSYLQSGWYRFTGAAGNRMLDACQSDRGNVYRCQTHAAGWLNGTYPLITDGEVSRTVCFSWKLSCCQWTKSIKVRNCGEFYVHYLGKVPVCNLRYCGLQ